MKQLNKEEIREYFDSLLLKEFWEIISSSTVFYVVQNIDIIGIFIANVHTKFLKIKKFTFN